MTKTQDRDTRYFIEINLSTLKIIKCSYDQKEQLCGGKQTDKSVHRLFITEGQFNKMVDRCGKELKSIIK